MKFLVDAQLPRRLVYRLQEAGHEAIHTLDLPLGNRTPDRVINEISEREQRIVITKFVELSQTVFTVHE
jgi:predicted nuclease of predicted toxin-antitoxin system